MTSATIIWRRLDVPGHDAARLSFRDGRHFLDGTAVFLDQGTPCRLNYSVVCNPAWETESANVRGWIGPKEIDVAVTVDASHRWRLNLREAPTVTGCVDVDLNFSPSTNLLPIRRLHIPVGQSAGVIAAWLRFPSFQLEPLPQAYHHIGERIYRYESGGGSFVRDLTVDEAGFVTHYPGFFSLEEPI
jgi:hypothetical protein